MIEHYPFQKFKISAFQRAKKDKTCCGDSYFVKETDNYLICAVADGLGSGIGAKEASQTAIETIETNYNLPLDLLMDKVNRSLVRHRGAVVTIFKIDYEAKLVSFCGVGNVKLLIYPRFGKPISPLPKRGFLSGQPLRLQVQEFNYPDHAMFVLYSDGITLHANQVQTIQNMYHVVAEEGESYLDRYVQLNSNDDLTLLIGKPL
ncbi:negative regulator of sigma-B (phosphoserine phosphatase) [Scopulibacillus daqui]|uniref:Negative regulator of sigma-B (Phosphoserine phosphatase) n=1 Tax=Scopulibacillus daqui TaxID=1469162 RepID=A0ABS2PXC7_9BACL|nr:SpoIIE family protein phosphatase [Scopulibacillus daqui]MBM7644682.1 negative regulator of sigma-B (phosphoserine phosphatase) [Scopulibacillus daqui]